MGLDRDFKKIIKSHKENWDAISADPIYRTICG